MLTNRISKIAIVIIIVATALLIASFATSPIPSQPYQDYAQRHPGGVVVAVEVLPDNTGSDYYGRHPKLNVPGVLIIDATGDFYLRHPEWTIAPVTVNTEGSDYFQRHPELSAPVLTESLETPGLACESPVDCR